MPRGGRSQLRNRDQNPSMVYALMVVSPDTQTCINAVFICIHKCTRSNGLFDERFDGLLLHVGYHVDDDLTTPLNHPKDRWLLFLQCTAPAFSFESASTSFASLGLHHLRLSFMTSNHIGFVTLYLV